MKQALEQLKRSSHSWGFAMQRDIQGLLTRELGAQAIDQLADVQFPDSALSIRGDHGYSAYCWFGLAIKANHISLYSSPNGSRGSQPVAEADIRKALEDSTSTLQAVEGTQSNLTGIQEKGKKKALLNKT